MFSTRPCELLVLRNSREHRARTTEKKHHPTNHPPAMVCNRTYAECGRDAFLSRSKHIDLSAPAITQQSKHTAHHRVHFIKHTATTAQQTHKIRTLSTPAQQRSSSRDHAHSIPRTREALATASSSARSSDTPHTTFLSCIQSSHRAASPPPGHNVRPTADFHLPGHRCFGDPTEFLSLGDST